MKITSRKELKKVLINLGCSEELWAAVPPPRAAELTALELWIKQVPENDETEELRWQLRHLHHKGVFNYDG